jgi:hypothetical protein
MSEYKLSLIVEAIDKATALKDVDNRLQSLGASADKTIKEIQPLGAALAAVSAAGSALIVSSVMTAARTEELGMVLNVMAENARQAAIDEGDLARASDLTAESVWGAVEAIKEKGITTQVATKLTSQFVRYELDMAQSTDLARVAQDAAVISMQDSSEALDGLLHGILTYNPRVLRTYGINVQSADAFKMFADAAGIATDEMDNAQKAQAMLNAVLAEGESITGAYDAAMGSAGKQMRSMSRHWEEAKEGLGEAFLPLMGKAVTATTDLLKAFNALEPAQKKTASGLVGVGTAVTGVTGGFILLAPRIIATAQALGTLNSALGIGAALGNVGAAFSLVAGGATMAEVATLGFAGVLGGVVLPLTAAAAAAGALYIAFDKLGESADVIRTIPPEIDALTAASILLDESTFHTQTEIDALANEMGKADGVMVGLAEQTGHITHEMIRLGIAAAEDRAPIGDLTHEMWRLTGEIHGTGQAAGETGSSLNGLATSASTVAGAFGEMTFDGEQLWNLAMASGASTEALGALAQHLGIATEAEILNTLEAYGLIEAFALAEEQGISLDEAVATVTGGFRDLRISEAEAAIEARNVEDAVVPLASGLQEAADAADIMEDDLRDAELALLGVEQAARNTQAELARIERDLRINVHYKTTGRIPTPGGGVQELQHGTSFFPGGLAMVGEAGPELVALPRGSQVYPAHSPQTQTFREGNTYGGDTVYINDRLAGALYLEQNWLMTVAHRWTR